jgi:hypothetical protein
MHVRSVLNRLRLPPGRRERLREWLCYGLAAVALGAPLAVAVLRYFALH